MRTFLPESWERKTLVDFSADIDVPNPSPQANAMAAMSKVYQRPVILFVSDAKRTVSSVAEYNTLGDQVTMTKCTHVPAKYLMKARYNNSPPIAVLFKPIHGKDHYHQLTLRV